MDQPTSPEPVLSHTSSGELCSINTEHIDADALKILQRLVRHGFEAYLVGGCVRDLLLGRQPKDFDIATAARPRQVKRLFRNSRIIGRRFKLVHVTFGSKIIEVSTFRGTPDGMPEDDLLILRDNAYGTQEQDALRRDFTVNALFYDAEQSRVIDWIGGQRDLMLRVMRTIGDPRVRLREDPVRILRAVKFATRLRFAIDRDLFEAMKEYHAEINRAAPPRVLEEVLRILRSGVAAESFALLHELGVLAILFPELARELSDPDQGEATLRHFLRALEALDHLDRSQRHVSNAILLATLFAIPVLRGLQSLDSQARRRDPNLLVDEILRPFARHTRLARRDVSRMKSIFLAQRRFERGGERRRRSARLSELTRRDYFGEAFTLFRILALARGEGDLIVKWEEKLRQVPHSPVPVTPAKPPRRRRRRRPAPPKPPHESSGS